MAIRKALPSELGALALRLAIGVNLFAHGLARQIGPSGNFGQWMLKSFANTPVPPALIALSARAIPPVELVLGLLLILGIQTQWVLFVAALEMCGLIFGMCLVQNWEIVGVQMIYVVCYFLLFSSPHIHFFSFDSIMRRGRA